MATLATLVVKLVGDAKELNDSLDKSASRTQKFAKAAQNNLNNMGKSFGTLGSGIKDVFSGIGQAAGSVIGGLRNMGSALVSKIPLVKTLGTAVSRIGPIVRESLGNAFRSVAGKIGSFLAPVQQAVANVGLGIATVVGRIGKTVAPVFNGIKTAIGGIGKVAGGALGVLGNFGGFLGNIAKAGLSAAGALAQKLAPALQSVGKVALVGAGIIGGALLAGLVAIGPKAINAASDFRESLGKVNTVFGESAGMVEDFSKTTAFGLGISQRDALAAAGTFGNLFRTMQIGEDASAQMSMDLVTLSADLASFNNMDPTEVLDKLRSGLVGETEPLRSLGINLTDAAVRAKAVEMGLASTTKEVDQAALTQARYALILEQSALAQGDFERTSSGLANQQRILGAVWQDILQKVGGIALPLLTGAMSGLLGLLQTYIIPAIEKVVQAFSDFQYMVGVGVEPLKAFRMILERFLPPETAKAIEDGIRKIITGVQQFIAWVAPIAQSVMAWVGENVRLQDVLIAIGAAIATIVVPAIGSIIAAVAPVVLTFVALVAAVAAVRTAWETDFLGIRTAVTNLWTTIQPTFQMLVDWFQTNIPVALQAVSDVFNNVVMPAFQAFYDFVSTTWWPLLESIGNFIGSVFNVALEAMAGIWQNVLQPAIEAGAAALSEVLQPALENAKPWLDKIQSAFEGIKSAIESVTQWFDTMAGKLDNMSLPDWMTPGSPTPLELGLLGIADAMDKVSRKGLPQMNAGLGGLSQASPVGGIAAAPAALSAGGGGGAGIVNFYIDGADDPRLVADTVIRRLQEIGVVPSTVLR